MAFGTVTSYALHPNDVGREKRPNDRGKDTKTRKTDDHNERARPSDVHPLGVRIPCLRVLTHCTAGDVRTNKKSKFKLMIAVGYAVAYWITCADKTLTRRVIIGVA